MDVFDGRQLTAARVLAGVTVRDLARAAGVASRTIHRLEIGGTIHIAAKMRHGHVRRAVFQKITHALAEHGVELLPESEDHGAGVRWIQPRAQRHQPGIKGLLRALREGPLPPSFDLPGGDKFRGQFQLATSRNSLRRILRPANHPHPPGDPNACRSDPI